jgi:hypothetical protein
MENKDLTPREFAELVMALCAENGVGAVQQIFNDAIAMYNSLPGSWK